MIHPDVAAVMTEKVIGQGGFSDEADAEHEDYGTWHDTLAMTPDDLAAVIDAIPSPLEVSEADVIESPDAATLARTAQITGVTIHNMPGGPWQQRDNTGKWVNMGRGDVVRLTEEANRSGGFTFDLVARSFIDSGYQVAIPGHEKPMSRDEFASGGFAVWLEEVKATGTEPVQVGGWIDGDNQMVLDVTENFDTLAIAGSTMIERGEQALWDFNEGRSIYNPERAAEITEPDIWIYDPGTETVRQRSAAP